MENYTLKILQVISSSFKSLYFFIGIKTFELKNKKNDKMFI